MPRYIDAERLDEIVEDLNENHNTGITRYEYKRISAVLWEFPTADVVERKKGKWVLAKDGWYCSLCELYPPLDCDPEEKGIPYCPWCGAEMKGKDDGLN